MIPTLKLLAMGCLGLISYQDFRDRQVFWFLFPTLAAILGILFFLQSEHGEIFLYEIGFNIVLVSTVLSILYIYTKLISKKTFLDHSMGLGDIFFFYAFALGFPSLPFVVLFVCSILFSVLAFLLLKSRMRHETVPLAGFMGLFLIFVLGYSLMVNTISPYGY